jgi:DNA-binding beta-propeller fold protein YncE
MPLPKKPSRSQAALAAVAMLGCWIFMRPAVVEGKEIAMPPFPQRIHAPPLPEGLTWLNTAGPLELADLRGKFVLLDFWTFCCINCMHILPELAVLEQAHPNELVVIGVHSAKFATEKESRNIAEAILRYRIKHPVINDAEHRVWDRFEVQAWPTLLLVDPEGYIVWAHSGETTADKIEAILKRALPYYRQKGLMDPTPLRFDMESQHAQPTPLRFPGKILADEAGGRLLIADSGHNRIVVARLDGTLLETIGSGSPGNADGNFARAEFNDPQGMALRGPLLYVADNLNHDIRKVDFDARRVTTVAGEGRPNHDPPRMRSASPKRTALSSPWDLWIHGDELYIAMAGIHQIWRMRLDETSIGPYAGNGREDIVDGPLLPRQAYEPGYASFAQPCGLTSDGAWLYVADSEGSSIRAVPLAPKTVGRIANPSSGEAELQDGLAIRPTGKPRPILSPGLTNRLVRTVVGTSRLAANRLFTFGDADGPSGQALFQHPMGLVYDQGRIYVADTYNNKIRVVQPKTGATTTLAGTGRPGRSDSPAQFDEPAGITAADGKLYVADTNNHLIRVIDLKDGRVSTLSLAGLTPPKPPAASSRPSLAGAAQERLPLAVVRPEKGTIRFDVSLKFPPGFKINPQAPPAYWIEPADQSTPHAPREGVGGTPHAPREGERHAERDEYSTASGGPVRRTSLEHLVRLDKSLSSFPIELPVDAASGRDLLRVGLSYYYCREGAEGLCKVGSVVWTVPLELKPDAPATSIALVHRVQK